jgi:hypothetical protein
VWRQNQRQGVEPNRVYQQLRANTRVRKEDKNMSEDIDVVEKLLNDLQNIQEAYDKECAISGKAYNLFNIAGITEKEVIMCRVIADLLNPKGAHHKGSLYLNLFIKTICKDKNASNKTKEIYEQLDCNGAKVITECEIDNERRIDIAIFDDNIFIPIEVKIYAQDQKNQVHDYYVYGEKVDKDKHVPVLYLTLDGHKPFNNDNEGKEYLRISWQNEIIDWLNLCLLQPETQETERIRVIILHLIDAIKSISGIMEDEVMDETAKLIMDNQENLKLFLKFTKLRPEQIIKEIIDEKFISKLKEDFPFYKKSGVEIGDEENYLSTGWGIAIKQEKWKNLYLLIWFWGGLTHPTCTLFAKEKFSNSDNLTKYLDSNFQKENKLIKPEPIYNSNQMYKITNYEFDTREAIIFDLCDKDGSKMMNWIKETLNNIINVVNKFHEEHPEVTL